MNIQFAFCRISSVFICLLLSLISYGQTQEIRLLVRIDDMGFSHAANVACIETYEKGIAQSVEVMVPTPWFEEAATMLMEHSDLDVGIHLTLTSEWSNLKWRPLTKAESLTNEDGYFYPMIWKNENFEAGNSLTESDWSIEEIEQELRAQIELALKKIPHISHLSDHMGCMRINEETKALLVNLAEEYGLAIFPDELGVKRVPNWSGNQYSAKEKEKRFIAILKELEAGDWFTLEHPGYDVSELESVGHIGYENVATDRQGVTEVFTSKKVKKMLRKRGIRLISYKDL